MNGTSRPMMGYAMLGAPRMTTLGATPTTAAASSVVTNAVSVGISGGLLGLLYAAVAKKDLRNSTLWGAGIGAAVGVVMGLSGS